MRYLILLPALLALAQSPRPTIQVPDELASEYFRQAYTIEHALVRQKESIKQMEKYCAENVATLQRVRAADDEPVFVCVPNQTKETK